MKVSFEWDVDKELKNLRKHQLSFSDAIEIFNDPFALIAPDPKHSTKAEVREWIIGEISAGVVLVVFTIKVGGRIVRIISARKASRKERALYEINKRIPI